MQKYTNTTVSFLFKVEKNEGIKTFNQDFKTNFADVFWAYFEVLVSLEIQKIIE